MPLDSSLFYLVVRPRSNQPGWIDYSIDRSATGEPNEVVYSAHKDATTPLISLFDPLTSTLLGSHTLARPSVPNASPTPKHRLIRLEEPLAEVKLKAKTGLSWCWEMEWEGATYAWDREVINPFGSERGFTLNAVRKPDPDFPVASYHPKRKGGSIEIYDHNLARVDPPIKDKKGLEIATLLALSFFIDHLFALLEAPYSGPPPLLNAALVSSPSAAPPNPPTPPAPSRDASRLSNNVRTRSRGSLKLLEINEVEVEDASPAALEAYGEKCLSLLTDPTLLYLVLFTASPTCVPAVASLAERVKRQRYKVSGEEMLMFADDSGANNPAGTDVAAGSTRGKQSFAPPPSELRIYLSRIPLDELLPNYRKPKPAAPPNPPIRPPIVFDSPTSSSTSSPAPLLQGRRKSSKGGEGQVSKKAQSRTSQGGGEGEEGGGWRGWLRSSR
ncbi:hypothetical protein JCM11641_003206 [Rhodosporidiobolus odoratus]